MLRLEPKQTSFHALLYNKIPQNHILKTIENVVDFSFINDLLADSYSKKMGRPAKEPEMMCKLLFLQHLYDLSDERVIEEASLNLAHMYFLKLNPEDTLPDKSLLAKFRCHRLSDISLDEIITEIVKQCVNEGIIESNSISIDATHVEANTIKKTPERVIKHLARKIIKSYQEENQIFVSQYEEPDYESIEDHNEAKNLMKSYLENVIEEIQQSGAGPDTEEMIEKAQDIISEPQFILQKGLRSLVDEDARVGRKSKNQSFFGYKAEFAMMTEENIITALCVENGAYTDGNNTELLLKNTLKGGIGIKEVYGDKAYFRAPILEAIKEINAEAYIPVSRVVYRMDENEFTYNKDADEWICSEGNRSLTKKYYTSKQYDATREGYKYYFDKEQCEICPKCIECAGKKAKKKILNVGLNTAEFYEISQKQKSDMFLEKYHKRASIESKNAELKRFHGLNRARGYGLLSMSKQAKLTAIAVNIKAIGKIIIKKTTESMAIIRCSFNYIKVFYHFIEL